MKTSGAGFVQDDSLVFYRMTHCAMLHAMTPLMRMAISEPSSSPASGWDLLDFSYFPKLLTHDAKKIYNRTVVHYLTISYLTKFRDLSCNIMEIYNL